MADEQQTPGDHPLPGLLATSRAALTEAPQARSWACAAGIVPVALGGQSRAAPGPRACATPTTAPHDPAYETTCQRHRVRFVRITPPMRT